MPSPSLFPLRALRTRLPLLLLVAGAALTLFAAGEAYRTGKSNGALERRVLREYSAFVAWAYANALETTLRGAAREALGAVNHGSQLHMSPVIPAASDLAHYLPFDARCGCHRAQLGPAPETFFAFNLWADTLQHAINTHPDPSEGWEIDRPVALPVPAGLFTAYTHADRDTLLRLIKRVARDIPDRENGFTYVIAHFTHGPRAVAYTLMPTARGDTMVYGAQYTASAFAMILSDIMDQRELLPEPFRAGRRNRDVVEIAVVHGAQTIYSSVLRPGAEYLATATLSPRFGDLEVRAAIRADQAGTLVVGGLPRSRMPFVLGLLVLAAALTLVAVMQLRREDELARVRAGWVASVSHELRTPLAQIRLYLDTLRLGRAPTDERWAWALGQVDRETTRLGHLVEKVLSFSRVNRARREPLQRENPAAAIPALVDEFRPLADARRVRIDVSIDTSHDVRIRRDGLRHVLFNLLDNAVKYGPEAQTVRVAVSERARNVEISVADEGVGVARHERDVVWRSFTRGAASTVHGGSGIGLAIVREIADEAGGRAWVDDAPGGGARFVVAIPPAPPAP